MKRFLVIQTAFLGDAVLVTSILEKLHAFHPDARIDLVVRKGNDGLFIGHPFIHTLHVWNKREGKTKALFKLIGQLRKTKYDHIINAQRFFSTGLMTVLARGGEKIGYDKNPLSLLFTRRVKHVIGDGRHEVDRLNALIEHLTDTSRPLPRLHPTDADRRATHAHMSTTRPASAGWAQLVPPQRDEQMAYVCIAPASVWFTKQWPEAKWIELIKALPTEQQVFLIGAPGDSAMAQRIIAACGRGVDLTRELKLLESAALMEGATMNYVNDSAPLHIASAMNAPVTAVFCSTVPAFGFGPLRENGRVVETSEQLDCRPCGLHGYMACPKGHFKCALGVEVRSLLS
ncbi:MAG: glycosyltransferase family 9 protein [Flavobacteriales bacterium]|nr:glycosyltransferase family 9 protein [Flavobacteriales bacterium]